MIRKTQQPWWMSAEQTCLFCLFDYGMLAEIYCTDCDRAVCPGCIVIVHEMDGSDPVLVCPECRTERDLG